MKVNDWGPSDPVLGRTGPDWPMRLLVTAAVVALALAGSAALESMRRLESAQRASAEAYDRLVQLNLVMDLLLDEETGSRGFVLTGDSAFLQPYLASQGNLERQIERALAAYSTDSAADSAVTDLARLVGLRRAHTDSTVQLRVFGFERARQAVASGRGRILMDSVRDRALLVIERERAAADSASAELRLWLGRSYWAIGVEGVIALALLLGAALMARRRRLARDAAMQEVERLNAGLEVAIDVARGELRESEQRLSSALERLFEGCQLIDFEGRYAYVNPSAARQLRAEVSGLVGRPLVEVLAELVPGTSGEALAGLVAEVLSERVSREREFGFEFADGTVAWFHYIVEPVPTGAFVLSVDITEEVRARDALAESESRLRSLLSGLPECVAVLDARGRITDAHLPEHSALTSLVPGVMLVEALGGAAAVEVEKALQQARVGGRPVAVELRVGDASERKDYELVVVFDERAGSRFTVVARDVTARRSLEAQLRQAQKMEAVGQLTGGIAHDFNNILTVIGATAELLANRLSEDEAATADLEQILEAKRKGAGMIAQLLSFSRRGMLQRELLAPAAVVRSFGGMLTRLVPETIRIELGELDESQVTRLDPGALEQMLANLVTNARDAMPTGGRISVDCRASFLDSGYHATHPWVTPGHFVCIAVSDTGQGMSESVRQRIFEPFFTTKSTGQGSGLGLAMVYGMMKEHGGMVHVYSELGAGSVVRLYFPVVDGVGKAPPRRRDSDPTRVVGGSETILFVEDEATIRMAARRALESKGYTVLEALDGEEALRLLRRDCDRVDLVVSDLVMPNLGGRQMVDAMREGGCHVPVLFTSGYSAESFYLEAQLPKGTRFLHKPWSLADLFRGVRQSLDERGS